MLLLLPFSSFSQKIIQDKIDDFTNTRSISTDNLKIDKNVKFSLLCVIAEKDGLRDTVTTVFFIFTPSITTSLREDSKTIIKFNDDSITELPYKGDYQLLPSGDVGVIYATLADDDIEKIKLSGINKVRLNTSSQNIDFSLDKDSNAKFVKAVNLVLERAKSKGKS